MYIFLLKDTIEALEKRYIKIFFCLSLILALTATLTRWLRMQKVELFNNDITVGFEHIVAGFGIPSFITVIFLFISILIYQKFKNENKIDAFFNSVLYRIILLLVAIFFTIDLSFSHEIIQACKEVYGNDPRGYIQTWQIICDQIGVFLYIIFTLKFYSKHNKILEDE